MRRVTPLVWVRFGMVSLTVSVMMAGEGPCWWKALASASPSVPGSRPSHLHSWKRCLAREQAEGEVSRKVQVKVQIRTQITGRISPPSLSHSASVLTLALWSASTWALVSAFTFRSRRRTFTASFPALLVASGPHLLPSNGTDQKTSSWGAFQIP